MKISLRCSTDSFKCYISAIVLGMNDALVELTGALAGFTMALGNNRLIALAGLTTGVAATLSMAAAEFLSQEAAKNSRSKKAALVTGLTYLTTTAILLLPFFIIKEPLPALALCLFFAASVIFCFTYATSRVTHTPFLTAFLRMLLISFSVAAIAFAISWGAKAWWGIDV